MTYYMVLLVQDLVWLHDINCSGDDNQEEWAIIFICVLTLLLAIRGTDQVPVIVFRQKR